MEQMIVMNTTPAADDLWSGIGGHFDSFTQVVCEFIDNSIANFDGKRPPLKTINIMIKEDNGSDKLRVSIEDTGTGIPDFGPVLKLGDRSIRYSPLNEHGFGLKHALASANQENNDWKIFTRTNNDVRSGEYREVSSPYSFDMAENRINTSTRPWPGIFNSTGTFVEFSCPRTLFNTIRKGVRGRPSTEKILDYLREDLGHIYSGVIQKGRANITLQSNVVTASGPYNKTVEAVVPVWVGYYDPKVGTVTKDLGGGPVKIEYTFGEMKESSYLRHYKRNQATSGVEIRVNGRLLAQNLFTEIWHMEVHPSHNHFLVLINLDCDNLSALPKTRTSKNGIRSGDEKLEKLFEWIRDTHPEPEKKLSGAISERELVNELYELKKTHITNSAKRIEIEFEVFKRINSPVPVDLYVFDGNQIFLYEAKKDTADVQNIYQLLMYWDGAVADGLVPTQGILIASNFSPGVDAILNLINSMEDQNGNMYNLIKRTWNEERIDYPEAVRR